MLVSTPSAHVSHACSGLGMARILARAGLCCQCWSQSCRLNPRGRTGFYNSLPPVSVWLSAFPATVVQSVKFVFSLFQRFTVAIGFVCICWMYYLNGILCSTDYNYNWFCCICWMFYFKRFMSVVVSLSLTLLPLWFVLSGKVYFLLLVVWW